MASERVTAGRRSTCLGGSAALRAAKSPAASNAGNLYFGTDAALLSRDKGSGNGYSHWGPIYPLVAPPNAAAWTWVNQGTASVSDSAGGVFLNGPAASSINWRCLVKSAPGTPYTITACFLAVIIGGSSESAGLVWRQSSDGKLVTFGFDKNSTSDQVIEVSKYTNPTTFSAHYSPFPIIWSSAAQLLWMRISDDGTNRKCFVSADGVNWIEVHSVGRTDFLTADQVGWAVNPRSSNFATAATLISWQEA